MEKKGQYYELFTMQAEGYLDKSETATPAEAAAAEGNAAPAESA